MRRRRRISPWLGGPGARWAQLLLLALHLGLLLALVVCLWTFVRILPLVALEPWQEYAFLAGIAISLVFFAARALRIAADLWAARPGAPPPPESEEDTEA